MFFFLVFHLFYKPAKFHQPKVNWYIVYVVTVKSRTVEWGLKESKVNLQSKFKKKRKEMPYILPKIIKFEISPLIAIWCFPDKMNIAAYLKICIDPYIMVTVGMSM